jgi:hypothetical protein
MPLAGEQKRVHNLEYYETRKELINARRIISMLQSGKRKYIRPETVSKYINVFSQEELEYVRSFDPVKRTLVPSNPETVPARVPVPVPNTGPKKNEPVVKSGKNPFFSADDIRNIVRNNTTIANTLKTYESRINPLMNLFKPKNGDFAAIYKNSFKTIVKKVSDKYKNPSAYLQFLLWVSEKANVTNNIKLLEDLRKMFRKSKGSEKVASRAQRVIADESVDYDQMYDDLFENEADLSKTENASQKHLLSVIYSRGLYSDTKQKKNLIIPRNYYFDVEIQNSNTKSDQNNFKVNTGVMTIHQYKTADLYGTIKYKVNAYTSNLIKKSLKSNPRKFLFTKANGQPFKKADEFNPFIKNAIGIGIDDFRRAIINHELNVNKISRDVVADRAGHSVETNELVYSKN